jgi:hypothetical protein
VEMGRRSEVEAKDEFGDMKEDGDMTEAKMEVRRQNGDMEAKMEMGEGKKFKG